MTQVGQTFSNIEAFYADNEARRWSGESDFGVWWTGPSARFPRLHVAVVHDTGEVYAEEQLGGGGRVQLLGYVDFAKCDLGDSVTRHGDRCAYTVADAVLEGWADRISTPNSIAWVAEQVRDHMAQGAGFARQRVRALRRVAAELRDASTTLRILEADGEASSLRTIAEAVDVVAEVAARRLVGT